ncbi:hypothetical protein FF098_001315 [Parvularcula flava]|uniref:Putative Flp pilus-assembly TadG-like N-terminal domain-containing protein n=1 Tax=Aquisalinus luteolus TaxID=1566827 RepID=A0A8J3A1V5_9PROT|nr:pilus assembly protein TadG-related protein [Aquisalinus luteolus]NHK26542.1 hypothetical protein [Aquisalinus luteolus]GGH92655.1 hypothetical protein GCM10011355_02660 [Aquisalinus luteolus]
MKHSHAIFRETGGNVAIFTGIILPVAVMFCGLVLDQGSMNVQQRKLQNATDMAAISGASAITQAEQVALASLADNGITLSSLDDPDAPEQEQEKIAANVTVERGQYLEDALLSVSERFTAGRQPYNAVRVSVNDTMKAHFNPLDREPQRVTKTATAAIRPAVAYSVGSRLASLDGGIANDLLGALTGSDIDLTVMDYNALTSADVDLLGFLDALAREVNITAGTYQDVLQTDITQQQLMSALKAVSSGGAWTALGKLGQDVSGSSQTFSLDSIIDLGSFARSPINVRALTAKIGVMELLSVSAMAANGTRQVEVDLDTDLPGLAGITLDLAIGSPMESGTWMSLGPSGTTLRTAQTRLRLLVSIGDDSLPEGSLVSLPLYLELASAEAGISSASCAYRDPSRSSATIAARPGIAQVWIGTTNDSDFTDFSSDMSPAKATLLNLTLARVKARAHAEMANSQPQNLYFSASDISQGTIKTAQTNQYTELLLQSLLDDLEIDIEALGLGLSVPGGLGSIVSEVLGDVTPSLDTLLSSVLQTLGVGLGEADVRVHVVHCTLAELVQ